MPTHIEAVQRQFEPRTQAYLESAVHAHGPDLAHAGRLIESALNNGILPAGAAKALDVGCGAGHLSFALAPLMATMVALDPSAGMLSTVAEAARVRGLGQIETRAGVAESLPCADASFDLVCSRYSAHHWTRLASALREMRRVLTPGGRLLIIDVLGHEDALVDTHLQAVELLRDPSHVRDRAVSEWQRLLAEAGFGIDQFVAWPTALEFSPWVERMHVTAGRAALIREVQIQAPHEVQAALEVQTDGTFTVQTGSFWAGVASST